MRGHDPIAPEGIRGRQHCCHSRVVLLRRVDGRRGGTELTVHGLNGREGREGRSGGGVVLVALTPRPLFVASGHRTTKQFTTYGNSMETGKQWAMFITLPLVLKK